MSNFVSTTLRHLTLRSTIVLVAMAWVVIATPANAQKSTYYVASFNIQNLGQTKVSKTPVRRYLAEVVREFDIVAVQEVSDVHEKTPGILLDEVNSDGSKYQVLLSPRTGLQPEDHSSQEQYAFYYNAARIEILGEASLYDDAAHNYFRREPYTAHFKVKGTDLTFTVTQIHTAPARAVQEIDALIHVYQGLASRFPGETNHVIVGDFNGSCNYAKPEQLKALAIRKSRDLVWVVGDDEDTTVSESTHCAYDRIITTRAMLPNHYQWGIASWFTDKAISDHWPVWISFKPAQ